MPRMAQQRITLTPMVNMPFYQEGNNVNILGQVPYELQVIKNGWQGDHPYYLQTLYSDPITIQVHTQSNSPGECYNPPTLSICMAQQSDTQDAFGNARTYTAPRTLYLPWNQTALTAVLNAAPIYKGSVQLFGNIFTDPITGIVTQLDTTTWQFSFEQLASYFPNGGLFFFCITNNPTNTGTDAPIKNYSEPIFVDNLLPLTHLFQSGYNSNRSKKFVVNTGFYNDWPTNSQPFTPAWFTRVPCRINGPYDPQTVVIDYYGQNYQNLFIDSTTTSTFTLNIGADSAGVPDYEKRRCIEAITADSFYIDTVPYVTLINSASPGKPFKAKWIEGSGLSKFSSEVQYASELVYANQSPPSMPYTRIFTSVFNSVFQ